MGHFAYCTKCDAPMEQASLADAFAGEQSCPACQHEKPLDAWDRRWAVEAYVKQLEERLAALEIPTK